MKHQAVEIVDMTNVLAQIHQALTDLLPAMIADGGGAEFISYEEGIVTLKLLGSCNFCPSRQLSATALKRGLLERIPYLIDVVILYPSIPSVCVQALSFEKKTEAIFSV